METPTWTRGCIPRGSPCGLQLTPEEKEAVKAFLRTLAGSAIYTDPKWSDPFPSP